MDILLYSLEIVFESSEKLCFFNHVLMKKNVTLKTYVITGCLNTVYFFLFITTYISIKPCFRLYQCS